LSAYILYIVLTYCDSVLVSVCELSTFFQQYFTVGYNLLSTLFMVAYYSLGYIH